MGNRVEVPPLKMRDWAKADRPREKLMQKGSSVLTDAELLGVLIGSGTSRVSAVNLAQLILKHYDDDLNLLAKCSVKELQRFKGIGEAKAIAIVSAMELGRRRPDQAMSLRPRLCDSSSVYHFIRSELLDKPIEEFWIILINRANYLIKKQFISSGGLTTTSADPKIVFKAALDHQTAGIILAHNHPSGNPAPSTKDIALTKKLIDGGELLDIAVLDHIIVAGSTYFSFADEKLLFRSSPIPAIEQ
jgi:DNA repair protein RadC